MEGLWFNQPLLSHFSFSHMLLYEQNPRMFNLLLALLLGRPALIHLCKSTNFFKNSGLHSGWIHNSWDTFSMVYWDKIKFGVWGGWSRVTEKVEKGRVNKHVIILGCGVLGHFHVWRGPILWDTQSQLPIIETENAKLTCPETPSTKAWHMTQAWPVRWTCLRPTLN